MLPPPVDPRENILASLARGLPEFQPALFAHDGTAVMCGSGPSLPQFIEDVRAEREKRRPIVAVKGAHDLLCEHGIEPDLFISCEAKPRLENVRRKNNRTIYLLAGRCGPELYDWLADCKVLQFHTYSDKDWHLPELSGKALVGGGTTSGLRAVTLMYVLGFAKFVLYGYDSCLDWRAHKRYDSGALGADVFRTDRWVNGRRFVCNGAMAMQADEFQEYYKMFHDITFTVKGDGLLAAIVNERARTGRRT